PCARRVRRGAGVYRPCPRHSGPSRRHHSGRYDTSAGRPEPAATPVPALITRARLPEGTGIQYAGGEVANLDVALKSAMNIDGAIAVALVDYTSGMTLGALGGGPDFDVTVA